MRKIKVFGVFLFVFSSFLFLASCGNNEENNTFQKDESPYVDYNNFHFYDEGKSIMFISEYGMTQSDITIPNTVTSIGNGAFNDSRTLLNSLTIPKTVTSIGASAFSRCEYLEDVYYDGEIRDWLNISFEDEYANPMMYSDDFYMLDNNGTIEHNSKKYSKVEDVAIPNQVVKINDYAFKGCNLTSITIPNSVKNIGEYAFSGCNLTSITIPNSVKIIGEYAFSGCNKLVEVINKSSLNITKGSDSYGYIAFYAKQVISNESESKLSTDTNGFITYNDGTDIWLVNYIGIDAEITIPSNVTKINDCAFYNCNNLTSITIPDGTKSIGNYAFYDCKSLTSMTIPASIVSIDGYGAFYGCKVVDIVNKSSLIITIGSLNFGEIAAHAKQIISDESESKLSTDSNGFITYNDGTDIWLVNYVGNDTEITIPSNVTRINDYVFYNCFNLTSAIIPVSVTSVGDYAFYNCINLTTIDIPNSVISIENKAFYNCRRMSNVTLGNSVASIGYEAFGGTNYGVAEPYSIRSSIIDVYYKGTIENWNNITNGDDLMRGSPNFNLLDENGDIEYNDNKYSKIEELVIPTSITTIRKYAFYGFNIKSVTIPDSVTSIEDFAFYNCQRLVEVINKSSLNITKGSDNYGYIARYAKQVISDESKSKLSTDSNGFITYNDGTDIWLVDYIGTDTEITIPSNVTIINDYAFYNCNSLTSIIITSGVTSMGEYAFLNCNSLTTVIIEHGLTTIGNAFAYCYSLVSITIPNSVIIIDDVAFSRCSKLASIIIPDSVTNIGNCAFDYCFNLENVIVGNSVESIGNYAFYMCHKLRDITIGNSVTSIGEFAFGYCESLNNVYYKGKSPYTDMISINWGNTDLENARWQYI